MTYLYPWQVYFQPWRLVTLWLGLLFLLAGAQLSGLPDWDIPISLLMGLAAYVTAGPTMRVLSGRRWAYAHYAAFWTWYSVDGLYIAYWGVVDPSVLVLRPANAAASLALYLACGLVWYPTSWGRKFFPHNRDF